MLSREYQYIIEVEKSGSVSAAAANLFLTPSAVSKTIQKVETEFGVALFNRTGRRLIPTDVGKKFIAEAKEILRLQIELEGKMNAFSTKNENNLRIGVLVDSDITPALTAFRAQMPEVQLLVSEATGDVLWDLLNSGKLDLILNDVNVQTLLDFRTFVLRRSEFVLVVARNHPINKKAIWKEAFPYPHIDLSTLAPYPLISPFPNQRLWRAFEKIFLQSGQPLAPAVQMTMPQSIFRLVSQSDAYTIAFDRCAAQYVNSLNLSLLSFGGERTPREFAICCSQNHPISKSAGTFIEICQNTLEPPAHTTWVRR